MPKLKLISLNIEGSKHLDLVLPFLQQENPDVVCLQELAQKDIPRFEESLGPVCSFAPMFSKTVGGEKIVIGVGIFSKEKVSGASTDYYINHQSWNTEVDVTNFETRYQTLDFALASIEITLGTKQMHIHTTHFPVTENGGATEFQREALEKLFSTLEKYPSFVLCGDFNAPRGGEIFTKLAERFTDNIPTSYTTSIDGAIHRAGNLQHMVDGLFTTKDIAAHDVRLQSGVSDHMAVIAYIS